LALPVLSSFAIDLGEEKSYSLAALRGKKTASSEAGTWFLVFGAWERLVIASDWLNPTPKEA
jgi:NADH:ubiquinone oxidoreductase subunit 2 (subunit N)